MSSTQHEPYCVFANVQFALRQHAVREDDLCKVQSCIALPTVNVSHEVSAGEHMPCPLRPDSEKRLQRADETQQLFENLMFHTDINVSVSALHEFSPDVGVLG